MKRAVSIVVVSLAARLSPGCCPPPAYCVAGGGRTICHSRAEPVGQSVAASYRIGVGHHVDYQSNQSLCGPASIANILRSFGESTDTESKVLAHTTKCWSGICFLGLSLDELADVTRTATKRSVTVLRDLTPEAFRDELRHVNDPNRRYVINFTRAPIFGSGVGTTRQ